MIGTMTRQSPLRSLRDAAALAGMALIVAWGPVACGPPGATAHREVQAPVTDRPTASHRASTHLVLRLNERRLYLMKDDAPVESFPIAIGRAGQDTPTGQFQIEEMIEHPDYEQIDPSDRSRVLRRIPPGPENPLGERWMGIAHGEGWTVGIHGTPHPELLGQAVSGGCIRMRNADVIRVYDHVELGTKVIVHP
jgi:lipoprotein-anchoring transpeptidase ErfK/SrfK